MVEELTLCPESARRNAASPSSSVTGVTATELESHLPPGEIRPAGKGDARRELQEEKLSTRVDLQKDILASGVSRRSIYTCSWNTRW